MLGVQKNFGADDLPFKAASLPNLNAGGVLRYDDGSMAFSLMHAAPDKAPAKGGATYGDTAFSATISREPFSATLLAAYVKRTPAPAAVASVAPGVVTYSRSQLYGLSLASSRTWSDASARGVTTLSPVFRFLYGGDPYQTALNLQPPLERRASFFSHDAEVGIEGTFPGKDVRPKVTIGWVFDHVAPSCALNTPPPQFVKGATPASALHCAPGNRTSIVTGTVGANLHDVSVALQYKPSFDLTSRNGSPAERVYSAIVNVKIGECATATFTTTNDSAELSSSSFSRLKTVTQAELDAVTRLRIGDLYLAPTLVTGFTNEFGYDTASYIGGVTPTGPQFQFEVPFPTHKRTFYVGARVGTPSFSPAMKVPPKCLRRG